MMTVKIIGIVVLSVFVAGAVFLAAGVWNPSWNPFANTAGGDIEQALNNLLKANSLKYEGIFEIKTEQTVAEEAASIGINLGYSGALDVSDKENIKGSCLIGLQLQSPEYDFETDLEIRGIGQDLYLKIGSLPSLAGILPPLFDETVIESVVALLENQWFKISEETITNITGAEETEALNKQETEQFLNDLQGIISGHNFFVIEQELGKETLRGIETNRYKASLSKKALKQAIPEYLELAENYLSAEQKAAYQQELNKALTELPQAIDDAWLEIGGIEFEVWIAQTDNTLRKIKFERKIEQVESINGSANIKLELEFLDLNKSVSIEIPADAKDIEEVLAPLLMNVLPMSEE